MIRNLNLLKVTLVSLTAIPTISGTVRRVVSSSFRNFQRETIVNYQHQISESNYSEQRWFSTSKKDEKAKKLEIPEVKQNQKNQRGKICYCLSTRKGNDFPSITVLENGKETDYILPDWYQEWALMNWAMNFEVFPSWVEFGKLENGNYYAEFLDDEGDFMKQSTDQKQPKIVKELKDKWLETMEKLRGKE
jgi:hypothetical protein